jgi:hypothetical protein
MHADLGGVESPDLELLDREHGREVSHPDDAAAKRSRTGRQCCLRAEAGASAEGCGRPRASRRRGR